MRGNLYLGGNKVCAVVIDRISTSVTSPLEITPQTASQTITATGGIDGYTPITVNAVTASIDNNIVAGNIKSGVTILGVTGNYAGGSATIDSLSITPTTSQQTITASGGVDGYSPITVAAVTSSIDSNIKAANIKSGVTILGVSGTVTQLVGETRSVSITSTSGNTFTPSSGKNGITSITVTPTNQAKTITPTTSSQSISVPSGYSGFGTLTVNAVTSSIDSNITAGNIKSGVTILGVQGTYSGGGSTPVVQELNVTPSTLPQTINPGTGVDGFKPVNVAAVTASIDSNITAGNIKSGVTILGVEGTYSGGGSSSKYGVTIDNLLGDTTSGVLLEPTASFTADFSSVTSIDSYALYYRFHRSKITSVDFSNVTSIGERSLSYTFQNSTLSSVDLSGVTSVSTNGLNNAFSYTNLIHCSFPSLVNLSNSAISYCCSNCADLESFEIPKVVDAAGQYCIQSACEKTPKLKYVNVDKLQTIVGWAALTGFCELASNTSSLKFVNFKSLDTITAYNSLSTGFTKRDGICLYFPKLTTTSFGSSYTNQFNNMLSSANKATVFFPSTIEATIGSWSSVTGGFGGTGTTVIFYIPTMITVNLTQTTAVVLSYNSYNNEKNVVTSMDSTINYVAYDSTLNKAFLGIETNCTEGETRTNNINLNSYTYNTLTWSTGIAGKQLSALWNNIAIPLLETSSGNYTIKTNTTTGEVISLDFTEDSDYSGTYSITTNGSNITSTITPTARTYVSWTRPNLTDNGTLGGNAFAVAVSSINGSNYGWKAVDDSTSTYWLSSSVATSTYTIYNPKLLKVSSFVITWRSTTYRATTIVLEGSQDNENWDAIQTYTPASAASVTLDITTPKGYKYYRFTFTRANTYVGISNLVINATVSST